MVSNKQKGSNYKLLIYGVLHEKAGLTKLVVDAENNEIIRSELAAFPMAIGTLRPNQTYIKKSGVDPDSRDGLPDANRDVLIQPNVIKKAAPISLSPNFCGIHIQGKKNSHSHKRKSLGE